VFLTGVQALVRFLIDKQRRDRASGGPVRRTFITGYEGSPLGGLDMEVRKALRHLNGDGGFVHQPAVNEKIAAAAVHGSQYIGDVDGFWYGKAQGVKWTPDEMANFSGSGERSGVVMFCGDDHAAKSSVNPGASEEALRDMKVPVFYPATVEEVLRCAHHALALSRYSGLVTALKLVTPLCDGAGTVRVDPEEPRVVLPDFEVDGRPYQKRFHPIVLATASVPIEAELMTARLDAARAYARANGLNEIVHAGAGSRLGIVATGKSYADLVRALEDVGLTGRIRLLRLTVTYPVEPEVVRRFGEGLETVCVVEEKGPFVEDAVAHILLGSRVQAVYGKRGPDGRPFVPGHGELSSDGLVRALGAFLGGFFPHSRIRARMGEIAAIEGRSIPAFPRRAAHYCPGCPHSISAKAPAGEVAGGEIGCSSIDAYIHAEGRGVRYIPAMGLGGAMFNGMFPFNGNRRLTQNVGDGTLLHSGILSILSSVAHGANITYKVLWNHVVAMTGGQDISGQPGLDDFCVTLLGLGVKEVAVVSRYPGRQPLTWARRAVRPDQRLTLAPRDDLEEVQRGLGETPGVKVLIFDQACATETRRRRKRAGLLPERYLFIHERVCEGCGDCGRKSMCLALSPKETAFGRKTEILQSACNRDESCLKGDCPSFLTVTPRNGSKLKQRMPPALAPGELPEPAQKVSAKRPYTIYLIGIGGTGVVTVAHLLGFAAMFEGKAVAELNRTGLAQKGGPVESPIVICDDAQPISQAVPLGGCDLYLVADLLGGVNPANLCLASPRRTAAVVSRSVVPTAEMVYNPDAPLPDAAEAERIINACTDASRNAFVAAQDIVQALFGDHIYANLFLTGAAYQAGLIPLEATSIERAIVLNAQSVEANLAAFRWGRMAVLDPERVNALARPAPPAVEEVIEGQVARLRTGRGGAERVVFYHQALDRVPIDEGVFRRAWAVRVGDLIDYQDLSYARRYAGFVAEVYEVERDRVGPARDFAFTSAVAVNLYKLMAYKDEYEVARLLTGEEEQRVRAEFDGEVEVSYNLHPPVLRSLGWSRKIAFGPWFRRVLRVLRRLKFLRGTAWDPFGYAEVRRRERALIGWYEACVRRAAGALSFEAYDDALAAAQAPDAIRGYEGVKTAAIRKVEAEAGVRMARMTELEKTGVNQV
jgi:indolepyruvate ferredoxin oxidoreductase